MFDPEALVALLKLHGLSLLAPLAVIEGPIVTIVAAGFAGAIGARLWEIAMIVIAADLVGDVLFYGIGRAGPKILPRRFRARFEGARSASMAAHFAVHGGRTLLLGKLTHSLGAVVIVAAGAARMNLWAFLGWNLIGTIPKSLFFIGLGYWIGQTYAQVDTWLLRAGVIGAALGAVVLGLWLWRRRDSCKPRCKGAPCGM